MDETSTAVATSSLSAAPTAANAALRYALVTLSLPGLVAEKFHDVDEKMRLIVCLGWVLCKRTNLLRGFW